MANLKDVAKHAKVSVMTVSRVINESGYVRKETKENVKKAIKELNYRPNLLAKGLVNKRTKTIAYVLVNIADMFHPKVVKGVEDACYEKGYSVILCNANTKYKEKEYIQLLSDRYVDGIIFHHLNINVKQVLELQIEGIHCVLLDNENPVDVCSNIKTNDVLGGYLAGKALVDMGHRQIGLIHGSLCFDPVKPHMEYEETFQFGIWNDRTNGFLHALNDRGISVNPELMVQGDWSAEGGITGGFEAMSRVLERAAMPTAMYIQNDYMAIGAMNAVIKAGYAIPQDFSIIGHDGLDIAASIYPSLTTVDQPRYEMGYRAAQLLIEQIENAGEPVSIVLDPALILRETTAALPQP